MPHKGNIIKISEYETEKVIFSFPEVQWTLCIRDRAVTCFWKFSILSILMPNSVSGAYGVSWLIICSFPICYSILEQYHGERGGIFVNVVRTTQYNNVFNRGGKAISVTRHRTCSARSLCSLGFIKKKKKKEKKTEMKKVLFKFIFSC